MKLNHKITPYEQINVLIEKQNTGSANELARKIGVSRATIFNILIGVTGKRYK